ncbi:uncharacterized protein HGUI_02871 [Hanseniaspora guilliermondii]|uniref:Uncharacterized protein n=1 Tax=Hanseniaspora guilliermondii TaxID=56406 RepID=A0A1L0D0M3_9ASCO|nr:uncharacterized protein HGUI_02871 [Hanseniaspora guilliermondii]
MLRNIFKNQVRFNSSFNGFKSALHPEVNDYFSDETKNPNKSYVPLKNINYLFEKSLSNLTNELKEFHDEDLALKYNDPSVIYDFENTIPKLHSFKNEAKVDYNKDINRFFLYEKWTLDKSYSNKFMTSSVALKDKVNSLSHPSNMLVKDGKTNYNALDPNHKESLITHDDGYLVENRDQTLHKFGQRVDNDLIGGKFAIFEFLENSKLLPDTLPTILDLNTIMRFRFPFNSKSSFNVYTTSDEMIKDQKDVEGVRKIVNEYNNPLTWLKCGTVLNNDVLQTVPEFQIFDLRRNKVTLDLKELIDIKIPRNLDEIAETKDILKDVPRRDISIEDIKKTKYSIMMVTPDVVDYERASFKSRLHYMLCDIQIKDLNDNFVSEFKEGVKVIQEYTPPMPMKGETHPQRFAFLLLEQPEDMDVAALKKRVDELDLEHDFDIRQLVKEFNLYPIGANAFRTKYDSFLPMSVDHHSIEKELDFYIDPEEGEVREYKPKSN